MELMQRWFGRGGTAAGAAVPPADKLLNPLTWASVDDLIGLQRHAERIRLKPPLPARARLAGEHLSRFRGRGMDYQESRGYQAGDDVRSMDWRVTARTGRAHVKVYQEERERPVLLFVDLNAGMFFGSRMLKSVAAAHAAALLAWAAVQRGDRVGAMLCNAGHADLPARGGTRAALRLIRQLVTHTDPRQALAAQAVGGGLNLALSRLRQVSRPGSLVVLIGDFYGLDGDSGHQLQRLRRHCDVLALQIVDPLEESPPPAARYGVIANAREGILDTRSAAVRHAYQDYFSRHHQTVAAMMRRQAITLLRLSTGDDIAGALQRHFAINGTRPPGPRLAA